MHILCIHQYFATPKGSTITRSYEFAWQWVRKGHKVTILTTTSQLRSEDLEQASGWFFKRCRIEGINVLAVTIPYRQQMGMFKRCLAFLVFLLAASVIILFIRKVDVVYATSPPLTVGIPALVARWLRRKKFIFEVEDQWPEALIEAGIIKNKFLIKILLCLEGTIYKHAAAIVALSDGMAEGIREVAEEGKVIHVIPNGADLDFFRSDIDGSAIRRKRRWGDKLVFLHAGAMGKVNGLDFVIDAAEMLKEDGDIVFVLIGDGSQRPGLESRVKELGLTNVEILPSVPKQQLPEIIAATDVVLVIVAFEIMERHAALNKFYDGLSSGKPILLNYYGWQGRLVKDEKAGYGCKLCNLDEFVKKVLYLNSHREELMEMGQNARRIAETKFDLDKLAAQALSIIEAEFN